MSECVCAGLGASVVGRVSEEEDEKRVSSLPMELRT